MQMQPTAFLEFGDASAIIKQLRVRLLQILLIFLIVISIAFATNSVTSGESLLSGGRVIAPLTALFSIAFLLVVSRQRLVQLISILVLAQLTVVSLFLYSVTLDTAVLYLFLGLTTLATAFLTNRLAFLTMIIINLGIIVSAVLVSAETTVGTYSDDFLATVLILFSFGLIPIALGVITRYFVTTLERTSVRAQRSAGLLAASAEIGRNVSEMLELAVLLDRAVEIIRDRFAFYHVAVFLTDDEERYAHLTAGTGEVGERMLARGHRLPINANSVVGRAAQAQDVIIARDTDAESGHSFNELLPFTRSELAVPIVDNNGIVGVVDIQSRLTDAFTAVEIDSLRVIANQLATAIRNARLFEDKERSIRENKRLFIEAETNLREIQRLNRQLTKQAWSDYLRTDRRVDGVTLKENDFQNNAEWSEAMLDASRRRRAITEESNGKRKVAVPIELRGEVVGAIELETEPNNKKDDLVDMIRTVSQRLAVSLDNARLFEESNEATAQEQRVSEIVSQYQSADSVDALLRITLQGLAETLGAEEAAIRLGTVPDITEFDATLEQPDSLGDSSHAG